MRWCRCQRLITRERWFHLVIPLSVSKQDIYENDVTIGRAYYMSLSCFEIVCENCQDFTFREKRVKRFLWSNISLLVIKESAKPLLVRRKNVSAYWISHIIVDHMVE